MNLPLQELLKSQRQRLACDIDNPGHIHAGSIRSSTGYPRTNDLIVWKSFAIAVRACALGWRSARTGGRSNLGSSRKPGVARRCRSSVGLQRNIEQGRHGEFQSGLSCCATQESRLKLGDVPRGKARRTRRESIKRPNKLDSASQGRHRWCHSFAFSVGYQKESYSHYARYQKVTIASQVAQGIVLRQVNF